MGDWVVYRLGPLGYDGYSRISRTADQRRTRMGAGTLRRNGDPDYHGLTTAQSDNDRNIRVTCRNGYDM